MTGRVQGVGFRPFVYRTAGELKIYGWVLNGAGKVYIHAEGTSASLDRFETALVRNAPPLARPVLASSETAAHEGHAEFEIRASEAAAKPEIHVPPDMFTCTDCIGELTDPDERRYRYPFINCTQCGPRYTIITAMPYDRPNTSMAGFPLCARCRAEYESPLDRRFHAQPLACAECGPALRLHSGAQVITGNEAALEAAVATLRRGGIIATKGVGGYHLMCDAIDDDAVARLRLNKHRPDKPLAVMFPARGADGLDVLRRHTAPSAAEAEAITDPARPIVLVRRRGRSPLSARLAPGLRELGVFLPYSPLHHELLEAFGGALVATSGNLSGEPVLTENEEAETRLDVICDAFLQHDRPIVRPADDPVIRVIGGRPRLLRPGRGLAPVELELDGPGAPRPLLATGGHMKNTVALVWENRAVVSPHIGELDSPRSMVIFEQVIEDLQCLYDVRAEAVVCDAHPGYASTRWAKRQALPLTQVLHHHAHASALAAEHPDVEHWLVFTWDGVGLGENATLWGGEAFTGAPGHWSRASSFRPFRLSGGDRAGREPWRSAAALLWEEGADWQPPIPGADLAYRGWKQNLGVHRSTAVGRLFDAAAALVLGRHSASFEGQGPMELEALAAERAEAVILPLSKDESGLLRSDWAPLLPLLTDETRSPAERAAVFHESLAQALVVQAVQIGRTKSYGAVGLSGGVFQNRRLCERVTQLLGERGIEVRMHRKLPANDGGLCFGQAIEALAQGQA